MKKTDLRRIILLIGILALAFSCSPLQAGDIVIGGAKKKGTSQKQKETQRRNRRRIKGRRSSQNKKGRDKEKKEKERYHVVQINDDCKVVKGSSLVKFRSDTIKAYMKKKKAHAEACKKAEAQGKTCIQEKPSLRFKVLTTSGFTSEKSAKAYCTKASAALKKRLEAQKKKQAEQAAKTEKEEKSKKKSRKK